MTGRHDRTRAVTGPASASTDRGIPAPIRSVAVVVLNWNGRADTLRCLASLAAVDWPDLRVIVADNGSSDGSVAAISAAYPEVRIVENGANLGFAAGNNAGIAAALADDADTDAVLVLNNDTVVPSGAVGALVAALDADPGAGCVCPVLTYAAAPERLWFAGARYDPARARAGWSSEWERGRAPLPAHPVAIDRGVGAAMLLRAEVLRSVGMFAPELFYLGEDVDLSLRIRAAGWRILLVPAVRIAHVVAASQGGHAVSPLTSYYGTRNELEVGRRHGGLRGWRAVRRELGCVAVRLTFVTVYAGGGVRGRLACLAGVLAGWRDYRRRRLGPR